MMMMTIIIFNPR